MPGNAERDKKKIENLPPPVCRVSVVTMALAVGADLSKEHLLVLLLWRMENGQFALCFSTVTYVYGLFGVGLASYVAGEKWV
jgi:hypothetical protein